MGSIKEILGERKFSGGKNRSLNLRFTTEQPEQLDNEGVKFTNVSDESQYEEEKRNSTKYKFFGSLKIDLANEYYTSMSRKPSYSDFEANSDNWQFMLMQPIPVFDAQGNKYKGVKKITFTYSGSTFSFDFNKGLPLFRITPLTRGSRNFIGFVSVLNHNFEVDQIIKLIGLSEYTDITDGEYRIVAVDGKRFYVNKLNLQTTLSFINDVDIDESSDSEISKLYNNQPVIYGKKVVDGVECDYYVKKLKAVVDLTSDINNCAFSRDIWGNQVKTYQRPTSYNVVGQLDNHDRPIIDMYFGAFKKSVSNNFVFTSVDSNFKVLIPRTKSGYGIEKIYENVDNTVNPIPNTTFLPTRLDKADLFVDDFSSQVKPRTSIGPNITDSTINLDLQGQVDTPYIEQPKDTENIEYVLSEISVGDEFMSGLIEYNPNSIIEYELHSIWHTTQFTANNQRHRLSYKPFKRIPLKVVSSYVEGSVVKSAAPYYAKYNEKYQTYRWRDILDLGFYEDNGNGLDHTYFNGAHYVQTDVIIQVINHSASVYDFTTGKLLTIKAGDLIGDEFENTDEDDNNTFEEYKGIKC